MQTKQSLTVIGTLLFLFGVFGYIFPHWGRVEFTNNENLFHVVTGLLAAFMANFSLKYRQIALVIFALCYLALGIYGFALKQPTAFHIKSVTAQLDTVDNYLHILFGLAFAWYWLRNRTT